MTSIRNFQRTETTIIEAEVYNEDGVLVDPATSIKVTVTDPAGTKIVWSTPPDVTAIDMTRDATGEYHHDFTPDADAVLGWYRVHIVAIDSTRVSISDDGFTLEA